MLCHQFANLLLPYLTVGESGPSAVDQSRESEPRPSLPTPLHVFLVVLLWHFERKSVSYEGEGRHRSSVSIILLLPQKHWSFSEIGPPPWRTRLQGRRDRWRHFRERRLHQLPPCAWLPHVHMLQVFVAHPCWAFFPRSPCSPIEFYLCLERPHS